jgi:tetratricopeptide (TPR) repeat protein
VTAGLLAGLAGYGAALLVHLTSPGPTTAAALFGGALLAEPVARSGLARSASTTAGVWNRVMAGAAGLVALVLLLGAFAEIPLKRAVIAASSRDLAGADSAFALAATLRPWDFDVGASAGHAFAVLASQGNRAAAGRAAPWLAQAHRQLPRSATVVADQAAVAEATGDFATAARLLSTALDADPNNPQLILRRGIVAAELGDYPAAEAYLLRAARLAPHSPEPWDDLAHLYTLQGRTADAAAATAKAAAVRQGSGAS